MLDAYQRKATVKMGLFIRTRPGMVGVSTTQAERPVNGQVAASRVRYGSHFSVVPPLSTMQSMLALTIRCQRHRLLAAGSLS
jgi:hypothetical protein